MKKICIFNQKGGVGKTTTNINLCAFLAMEGYKVLTIDIDPQGNTTSGLGLDKRNLEVSMYDVLTNNASLEQVIIKSELIPNLYIAPSTMELAGAEVEIIGIKDRETILLREISKIKDQYDYIFIDCPPSLGHLTINAFTASDAILIPVQCEYYALEGLTQLIHTINLVKKKLNPLLELEGVVFTMYDSRTNLSLQVVENVKDNLTQNIYKTIIPRNIRLAEAPSHGLPINKYDTKSSGAESYRMLADEVMSR